MRSLLSRRESLQCMMGSSHHIQSQKMLRNQFIMQLTPLFSSNPPATPIIVESHGTERAVLGRNMVTQIKDIILSRNLCEILVTPSGGMYVMMRKLPGKHHVSLNGINLATGEGEYTEVRNGSTLSLYQDKYPYRVKLKEKNMLTPSDAEANAKRKNEEANERIRNENDIEEKTVLKTAQEMMVHEMTCSICMDIIVKATIASPCGHCYCASCIRDVKQKDDECPNCRTKIESLTWTRSIDSIIWGMVVRGEFEIDDVKHFLSRTGKKLSCTERRITESKISTNPETSVKRPAHLASEIVSLSRKKIRSNVMEYFQSFPDEDMRKLTSVGAPFIRGSSVNDAIELD